MKKIMIDIGHGGSDPGAQSNGLIEKAVNLIVGLMIAEELKPYDCEVKTSRVSDVSLPPDNRVKLINDYNPDICISIHHNSAADSKVRGSEVIHSYSDKSDDVLAQDILNRLNKAGMPVRRMFTKLNDQGKDWYYMIRSIKAQSVIVEGGFLSNLEDAKLLKDNSYLQAEANAIAEAIVAYLKLSPKAKPAARTLKQGYTGEDVKQLQQRLKALGYVIVVDGVFGPATKQCVVLFQTLHGIAPDGIVGPMTLRELQTAKSIPYQVLQYNKYIRIIKFRKNCIVKADVVDSIGPKETVKSMFSRVKPTIMINGGLFGMSNGVSLSKFFDNGRKITDGIYTDFAFVIDKTGKLGFKYVYPGEKPENDVLGASPSLIIDGKKLIDKKGLVNDKSFLNERHPRMAIGEDKEHFYIVCVHGRNVLLGYKGMTMDELAALGEQLQLVNFINIDGGGSSIALGPDGKPLNDPLENRAVDNGIAFWLEV